nr:hypothetical protein B0A51_11606 [Rachicladosporium sp. CCFEE 5018]
MRLSNTAIITAAVGVGLAAAQNSTYYNPTLPGWHSDPSCIYHEETFFCAISTFLAVPGIPIYASKDLINWKVASHVWTRPDQLGLPNAARDVDYLQGGFYAPNLRFHDGKFYITNVYISPLECQGILGCIFTSDNLYDDNSWSDAVTWNATAIDPDLFWDDDGQAYLSSAGIVTAKIDPATGEIGAPKVQWNGTGGAYPEGPHIYKKDGYYYVLIAEGGTELGHRVTMARSKNVLGPWEADPSNPVLTNNNTAEYFQTVGHADLFQDGKGNWWSMALATRSGPEWEIYPMGREAGLVPVTWNEGEWPIFSQFRGIMNGWELPQYSRAIPGRGNFVQDPDVYDFQSGGPIPRNLLFWRFPEDGKFTVSPRGHRNTLQISPSRANLTGMPLSTDKSLTGKTGLSFISRRQTHTLFSFSVDLTFNPSQPYQEAGISSFLTQLNHIDLGISRSNASSGYGHHSSPSGLEFRFRIETAGTINSTIPSSTTITPVPAAWSHGPIRLSVGTANATHFLFSAAPASNPNTRIVLGYASALVVSGGSGPFTGNLLGAYATCTGAGGNSTGCPSGGEAYVGRWRYTGWAQQVDKGEWAVGSTSDLI